MTKSKGIGLGDLVANLRKVTSEMQTHSTPAKRRTKLTGKVTPNSFDACLKGVPGGGLDLRWTSSLLRLADEEETGTKIATEATEQRLQRSAKNCDTTKSNYLV